MKTIKPYTLLFFLIGLCTPEGFSAEEVSPYALKDAQPEEKWRWRKSFKVSASTSISPQTVLDFADFHNSLARVGVELEESNVIEDKDTNILVPGITVLYHTSDGELRNSTGYLYNYIPYYKNCRSFSSFLSGSARTKAEVVRAFGHSYALLSSYNLLNADMASYYQRLDAFYKRGENLSSQNLEKFRLFSLEKVSKKETPDSRGTYFAHSEQWFIDYLSQKNYKSLPYDNLCKAIASAVKSEKGIKITNVILHLHSKYDFCDVCAPSLSLFLEDLKRSTKTIIKALKGDPDKKDSSLGKTTGMFAYNKAEANVDEALHFSIIGSSRLSKLGQADYREHYCYKNKEHGQRRHFFGLDAQSSDPQAITPLGPDLPYSYIQVPLEEIRIKVGDKIPF